MSDLNQLVIYSSMLVKGRGWISGVDPGVVGGGGGGGGGGGANSA